MVQTPSALWTSIANLGESLLTWAVAVWDRFLSPLPSAISSLISIFGWDGATLFNVILSSVISVVVIVLYIKKVAL